MIAHIRNDGETQSVKQHLDNVSDIAGEYGKVIGVQSCTALAGKLHDFSKLTTEFQTYIRNANKNPDKYKRGPDHSTAGGVFITMFAKEKTKDKESVITALTAQIIAIASLYHHGGLGDLLDIEAESPFLNRLNKYHENQEWRAQYEEAIYNFFKIYDESEIDKLFGQAVEEIREINSRIASNKLNQYFMYGLLSKYIYSCVIDADRYETAAFMSNEKMIPPEDYSTLWTELARRINEKISDFPKDTLLNKLRGKISDACYKNSILPSGIYKLNCPTGSGKNYAAMRFALNTAKRHNKARIIYVSPFISIIEQNAEAIRNILRENDYDELVEKAILELHSAKEVQKEDMFDDAKISDLNTTTLCQEELMSERMNAPIVFITMVRFLNTFFSSGTKNIRALHNFANSVIILDETQAIPIKTIAMVNDTLNFLAEICNCTIILSTATQPALDRTPEKVPALLNVGVEISECTDEMRNEFKRTEFENLASVENNTKEYIAEKVWSVMEAEGDVLVIFNTIKSVHILYEEITMRYQEEIREEEVSLYVLSTNLCAAHRKETINQIKSELGKKKLIVISSQLIESGVDISFRAVFRALAGLDSLIQSAGRCNRHGLNSCKTVYIIKPDFESLRNLQDIERGKDAMESLLEAFKKDPQRFDQELSSDKSISYYYRKYYERQREQMLYPLTTDTNQVVNMYSLLGKNGQLIIDYKKNKEEWDKRMVIAQSFKTAAKNFHIIDEYGEPILVPYKKGKDLINNLLSAKNIYSSATTTLLRKAQLYMVNISMQKFYDLCDKGALTYYEQLGIYILHEGYYHSLYGVSTEVVQEIDNYMF
ncbi:CRISPR-associated helicase Cas3' [Anaerosporobacter sp.]